MIHFSLFTNLIWFKKKKKKILEVRDESSWIQMSLQKFQAVFSFNRKQLSTSTQHQYILFLKVKDV